MPLITKTDSSGFVNDLEDVYKLTKFNWEHLSLNKEATRLSEREMKKDPMNLKYPHVGFKWNKGDFEVEYWITQAITSLRSDNHKYVVVSWHYEPDQDSDNTSGVDKGVRLSFVNVTDMDKISYRHVLLVRKSVDNPKEYPVFEPVPIHAGGLATAGSKIYVADTYNGFRVFDVNMIFQVNEDESKQKCGIVNGKPYGFNYLYVMPEVERYTLDQHEADFSFCSIDNSDENNPLLFTGNYRKDDSETGIISWWRLQNDEISTREALVMDSTSSPLPLKTQGALSYKSKLWFSCSGDKKLKTSTRDSTYHWYDFTEYDWPSGCEDLHYSTTSGNLWCNSEFADMRYVWAVKLEDYCP